jgi:hypothetical protein
MTELFAYLAAKGDALAIGVLLGAVITILWLYPPSRLEKPTTTAPANSGRKAGRVRVVGGAR